MINSEEQYTDYMENPIDVKDISVIKLKPGKPENEIADLASDLVYGQVPNGEGTGLEGIPTISINSYPKDGSREHNLLHAYYKLYKSNKDQTEFENAPLEVVNTWDKDKQQKWFTAQMNKGAKAVIPPLIGAMTLPWTIYGAVTAPLTTALSIGGGMLGAKIGGDYGRKIDIRRHGYTNFGELYGTIGGFTGSALGGFAGNTMQAFFPKVRLAVPTSVNKPYGNFENYFSRQYNNPTPESTFGRVLQKVVHPTERKYYHGSQHPFPIKNANMGTVNDIGLHASLTPEIASGRGNIVYKFYAPKPKGIITDLHNNNISAIWGSHTFKPGRVGPATYRVDPKFKGAFSKYRGNLKFTNSDAGYVTVEITDDLTIPTSELHNLKLDRYAKELGRLRKQYDELYLPNEWGFFSPNSTTSKTISNINSEAANILYKSGYPVIKYNNLFEFGKTGVQPSVIITSPKAIRLPINEKFNFGSLVVPGIQTTTWDYYK